MRFQGRQWRTIWPSDDGAGVEIIDQRFLPHQLKTVRLRTLEEAACAIADMQVRGAPLIGATAAWGMWLAMMEDPRDSNLSDGAQKLLATRPTAVNLRTAVRRSLALLEPLSAGQRIHAARVDALAVCEEDVAANRAIGEHGLELIRHCVKRGAERHAEQGAERHAGSGAKRHAKSHAKRGRRVDILTHCNAGWLATVDWGTALAPVYAARRAGIDVHVWVDETRPRNQGAFLTAWELAGEEIPHTVITDNSGGHLMCEGRVDLCLVGADRVSRDGSVYNKIGTYLKALAAHESHVPFYVACPESTIDWELAEKDKAPIEERSAEEIQCIEGIDDDGKKRRVRLFDAPVFNPGFDHTPSRFIRALICERGVIRPQDLGSLSSQGSSSQGAAFQGLSSQGASDSGKK